MKKKRFLILSLLVMVLILIVGCTPSAPSVQYGTIDVNSTPIGAKVYLDGTDTGQATPIVLTSVGVGSHTIKLDLFHYKIWENNAVTVVANEPTYLNPPLVVAPEKTITLQPGLEGIDSTVSSLFPNNNYGDLEYCGVGNTVNTFNNIMRTYIKFDLSTVPANAIVVDADLKLFQFSTLGTDNFTIGLYKVTIDWGENTIVYSSQPTCSVDAEITSDITAGAIIWKSWDIDTLVQAWLDGSITNYGVVLKDTDEVLISSTAYFWTSDYLVDSTKRPELVIYYYIP
ncbi:MAG: DNRLRE domain-containing protein [Candidatus Atribacteria bacterium]|nr:DNRLRE domain-containing protein [Candidatus Atribacteria bacterium]